MGVAYKFVHPDFAANVLRGQIRIGSLGAFAAMENDKGGDPDEGKFTRRNVFLDIKGSPDAHQTDVLSAIGFGEGLISHSTVSVREMIRQVHEVATLCLANSPVNRVLRRRGLAAVFQITNVMGFAEALVAAHPDKLGDYEIGPVQYRSRAVHGDESIHDGPSPFLKGPQFRGEREIRIIWDVAQTPFSPFISNCLQPLGLSGAWARRRGLRASQLRVGKKPT